MANMQKLARTTAILACAATGLTAAALLASPGSGITSTVFVTATNQYDALINNDRVKFQTKDPTIVRVQKLVFAAGSYSGWHHHPGTVIVAVESGIVTLFDANCSSKSYGPGNPNGSVFVEGHVGANQAYSAAGATVYVTYVAPNASPPVFRIEDDIPACAQ